MEPKLNLSKQIDLYFTMFAIINLFPCMCFFARNGCQPSFWFLGNSILPTNHSFWFGKCNAWAPKEVYYPRPPSTYYEPVTVSTLLCFTPYRLLSTLSQVWPLDLFNWCLCLASWHLTTTWSSLVLDSPPSSEHQDLYPLIPAVQEFVMQPLTAFYKGSVPNTSPILYTSTCATDYNHHYYV